MNERLFKFAKKASECADYSGATNTKLGAIAVYKGSIIGTAWNSNKTSPLQAKYNVYRYAPDDSLLPKNHAETALLQKIRWKFGNSIQWDRVEIYIYREYKDGRLALSRPCDSCIHMLKEFGIRKVFYTTSDGYVEEQFKER